MEHFLFGYCYLSGQFVLFPFPSAEPAAFAPCTERVKEIHFLFTLRAFFCRHTGYSDIRHSGFHPFQSLPSASQASLQAGKYRSVILLFQSDSLYHPDYSLDCFLLCIIYTQIGFAATFSVEDFPFAIFPYDQVIAFLIERVISHMQCLFINTR